MSHFNTLVDTTVRLPLHQADAADRVPLHSSVSASTSVAPPGADAPRNTTKPLASQSLVQFASRRGPVSPIIPQHKIAPTPRQPRISQHGKGDLHATQCEIKLMQNCHSDKLDRLSCFLAS